MVNLYLIFLNYGGDLMQVNDGEVEKVFQALRSDFDL